MSEDKFSPNKDSFNDETITDAQMEKKQQDKEVASENEKEGIITLTISEYEALRNELKKQKEHAEKQWDIAVRAKAEAENIRRRAERDIENAHKYGVDGLLEALLPVLDSLEQGLNSISLEDSAMNSAREGMELTLKMFRGILEKFSVLPINPEGEVFDPSAHEAIAMHATAEAKSGTILTVIQTGYFLHDRLLRPARVIVAKQLDKEDKT